jgi:hypothetical protein
LDSGSDYFDLLVPFISAAVAASPGDIVDPAWISAEIARASGIQLPLRTVTVLLDRLTRRSNGGLRKDAGAYVRTRLQPTQSAGKLSELLSEFEALGAALLERAAGRIRDVRTVPDALRLLCAYLDAHGISLLIPSTERSSSLSRQADIVVATFVEAALKANDRAAANIQALLQGLILARAVTLEELADVDRRLSEVTVYFDTPFVLQIVGLYGPTDQTAARESLAVLRELGAVSAVFDVTLDEVRRLLVVYETRLDTAEGRDSLSRNAVTRHAFAINAKGSDMRVASALLEENLSRERVLVHATPERITAWVEDEPGLFAALEDDRGSGHEQRENHDVNAIAAVMTIRAGRTARRLDECRAVFVSQGRVIHSVLGWWFESGHTDFPPIMAHSALLNACWLKRPRSSTALLRHELAAVCASTLDPSPEAWSRFRAELKRMVDAGLISSEGAAVVLIDSLSAKLLVEAEETESLATLNVAEIIDRVREEQRREVSTIAAAMAAERERHKADLAAADASREAALNRERDDYQRQLGSMRRELSVEKDQRATLEDAVRRAVSLVARIMAYGAVGVAVALVLVTVVFPYLDAPRFSPSVRRILQLATVAVGFIGSAFGASAWSLGPWLQRRIEKRIARLIGIASPESSSSPDNS